MDSNEKKPKLSFNELYERLNQFNYVARHSMRDPARFREAQETIKNWFAERGIELTE